MRAEFVEAPFGRLRAHIELLTLPTYQRVRTSSYVDEVLLPAIV
jgi:hypothetical protein